MSDLVDTIGGRRNVNGRYFGLNHPKPGQWQDEDLIGHVDRFHFHYNHTAASNLTTTLSQTPSHSGYLEPGQHPRPCDEALHPGLCAVRIAPGSWFIWDAYLGVGEGIEGLYPGTLVEADPEDNA